MAQRFWAVVLIAALSASGCASSATSVGGNGTIGTTGTIGPTQLPATTSATTTSTTVPATTLVAASSTLAPTADTSSTSSTSSTSTTTEVVPTALTTPTAAPAHTACTAVVHLGDSTSVGAMAIGDSERRLDTLYARAGVIDFRPEISGGRSIVEQLPGQENAVEVARRQRAAGFHGCWVIAVGTNDAANIAAGAQLSAAERIDLLMDVVGFDPVLWVNARTLLNSGSWADANMAAWNAALDARARRSPNIVVYDWAAVAEDGWFVADGIHPNAAGSIARAGMIVDALVAAYPG